MNRTSLTLRSLVPALALLACLAGCETASSPAGTGPELPAGAYLILSERDDLYKYEQYFVVMPGHRWEFVEYGTQPSTGTLCQVTRQQGIYSATDSTLTATLKTGGESVEKCGMTKADFNAYPFETAPVGLTETFGIRNVQPTGFESRDFFLGTDAGWHRYDKKAEPFGFF